MYTYPIYFGPKQYVCCLVVTQLKEAWREPKLSMRKRGLLGVRSKVFLENILAKLVFKNSPPTPPYVFTLQMLAALQSADLRTHSGRKV